MPRTKEAPNPFALGNGYLTDVRSGAVGQKLIPVMEQLGADWMMLVENLVRQNSIVMLMWSHAFGMHLPNAANDE